jgi:hypothetical protein
MAPVDMVRDVALLRQMIQDHFEQFVEIRRCSHQA